MCWCYNNLLNVVSGNFQYLSVMSHFDLCFPESTVKYTLRSLKNRDLCHKSFNLGLCNFMVVLMQTIIKKHIRWKGVCGNVKELRETCMTCLCGFFTHLYIFRHKEVTFSSWKNSIFHLRVTHLFCRRVRKAALVL